MRFPSSSCINNSTSGQPQPRSFGCRQSEIEEQSVSRRSERQSGETRRSERQFGETRRSERQFGETRRSERQFGETRRSESQFGETRRSERQFGETRRSERQFDETRRSERQSGERRQPMINRQNSRLLNLLRRSHHSPQVSIFHPSIIDNHSLRNWVMAERNIENEEYADVDKILDIEENRTKAAIAIAKTVPGSSKKKADTQLNLSNLKLTDLPDHIMRTHAKSADLSNNYFDNIPNSLTQVMNLTKLDLSHNAIMDIPDEFSDLVNLSTLDLSSNCMEEIPEVISELAKLQSLKLDNNQIKTISSHITQLIDLNELSVANNDLQALAPEIGAMPNLKKIDLSNNPNLRGIPPEWEQLLTYVLKHANLKNTGLHTLPNLERHPISLKTLILEENREMRTLPRALGPAMQNQDPDKITTTKKGAKIDIHTRDTYLIPGLASDGRLQIKHGKRTVPAGRNLPPSLLVPVGNKDNLSIRNMQGEPPTNEAPPQLSMDPAALMKKWEDIKPAGAGPSDLIGLKQGVDRQNLLTIFAHTYGELRKLQGIDLNIKEFNLALNVAMTGALGLPLAGQLQDIGALQPLPSHEIQEALLAVKHLSGLNEEQTNLAASQIVPLARQGVSLVLNDVELTNKANEIKEFYGNLTAEEITQVFSLAKGAFRQDLITKIAHVFAHLMSAPNFPLDGVEMALIFQTRLAENLDLPGNIREIKLPSNLENSVTDDEIQLIEDLVSTLETIDEGTIFKNYLETKPFWMEYVNDLASRIIVASNEHIDIEKHQIETNNGWTQEYRNLGLGLFRQDRLNFISHYDVYTRDEQKAVDNPKLISLNYQIQLADQLGIPGVFRNFPKDTASVICWRIPAEKLEYVTNAVLDYERLDDGRLFEEFLNTQAFWREHLDAKSNMYSNQRAFDKGVKMVGDLFNKMGRRNSNFRIW